MCINVHFRIILIIIITIIISILMPILINMKQEAETIAGHSEERRPRILVELAEPSTPEQQIAIKAVLNRALIEIRAIVEA